MSDWTAMSLPAALATLEIGARIYFRYRFGLHFRSRVFAEYPYDQFVEKAEPPFFFRLKKGFRSPSIAINQHGMRGQELRTAPGIKRALFIGESPLFGVKLFHENDLWSFHLKRILDERTDSSNDNPNLTTWDIMNFSFPDFNTFQYRAFFENELINLKPDLLILNIGGNDITQARMFGDKWFPGVSYPFELISGLSRKSSRWEKIINRSCLYFLLRRKYSEKKRMAVYNPNAAFKKEECLQSVFGNVEAIVKSARAHGIDVVFLSIFPLYELQMSPENEKKMGAIQSNWRDYVAIDGPPIFEYLERMKSDIAPRLNAPFIDIRSRFWNHPKRFNLFLDLYHLSPAGMKVLSEYLYEEIDSLGHWK